MSVERNIGVNPEVISSPEPQERDENVMSRWLAGALEVGGTMAFAIQRSKKGYVRAYPFISFSDSNQQFIQYLKITLRGGSIPPSRPWGWRLSGYKAAHLISSMEPHAVSRHEMVLAVQNWLNSETAERVQTAEEMKGYDRSKDTSVESYSKLVQDPAFVAGAIDNRGSIYPVHDKHYVVLCVSIYSKNHSLLLALKEFFGGSLRISSHEGEEKKIRDRDIKTKKNSYMWRVDASTARKVIGFTLPYLISPPYEGWDKLLIDEISQRKQNKTNRIVLFVQNELERFQLGELSRLSTNAEIARKFKLSERTAQRRMSALPKKTREEREKIIKSSNQQALTEAEIASLINSINQETQDLVDGKIDRLTTNPELAENCGIGIGSLNAIMKRLPKEIKIVRQRAILSQAAIRRNEKYRKSNNAQ